MTHKRETVSVPKVLATAWMHQGFKEVDLKLALFLWDQTCKAGSAHVWRRQHIRAARAFLKATKSEIIESLERLTTLPVEVRYPITSFFERKLAPAFRFLEPVLSGVAGTDLSWRFSDDAISVLVDLEDGYGRVHMATLQRLRSFAQVRLYMLACALSHSYAQASQLYTLAECCELLGWKDLRSDDFKRRIAATIDGIKTTGAFNDRWTAVKFATGDGRGRPIGSVSFWFSHMAMSRGTDNGADEPIVPPYVPPPLPTYPSWEDREPERRQMRENEARERASRVDEEDFIGDLLR